MPNGRPVQGEEKRQSAHTVQLDRRSRASLTGVVDVSSFHENEIILKVDSGIMVLAGDGLHIGKLLLEEGKLDVEGHIDSITYETPRKASRKMLAWLRADR